MIQARRTVRHSDVKTGTSANAVMTSMTRNSMVILEKGLNTDASTQDVEAAFRECSYDD
jgi:hypothetical protein